MVLSKMKRKLFPLLVGGVFCVVVMSLYRMLEMMQGAELQHLEAPAGQDFYRLQQQIDKLERLLSANNRLVVTLRDSLLHRQAPQGGGGAVNVSAGSAHSPADAPPGCRLAQGMKGRADGVQLLDVYNLLPFDNADGGAWKQGFEISYRGNEWDEQPLEVLLVPHSHNDPGWLKTFENYYQDQTRHILNNMLIKLTEDSRRKMIWAEISYFSKWWNDIDEQKREMVKRLVGAGQLELVTGGWVMADEANSHYFALLDQLIEGHQWIQRHLGVRPRSGWAVDPFGHSPSMAYLLKGAGLSNMVIQRVHYAVKKHFAQQQTLEFLWRQSWDSSPRSDITCHMMPFYSYDVPHTCGPNPAVCCQFDFHRLPGGRAMCPWKKSPQPITEQNVQERALLLLDQYRQKSRLFRSHVLLVPLGDDFRFVEASEWDAQSGNYQKLFDYFDQHPELHVKARFGTLSDYFEALHRRLDAMGTALPALRGDFFTYADRDDHYWSGYFTSRPFYKRLDRTLEATLRATEILFSLALAEMRRFRGDGLLVADFPVREHFRRLTAGRRSLALFQHHDGITGTSRDPVVGNVMFNRTLLPFRSLIIFNPTEQLRSSVISVVVDSPDADVVDATTGQPMAAQISAVWAEPTQASTEQFQLLSLNLESNQDKSGAYLFLPGEEGLYSSSEPPLVRVSRGPVFSDITSCFRHFTHTVRLLSAPGHAGRSLEISNMVDIRSEFNRELVMRLVSDVANGNRFYSDLNGFQMQQRRTLQKLPLQANFYPMTSAAFLQDATSRMSLLSAQSQAVASLRPGELEVVLDRRLQQDDNRGLGQGVTDNKLTASLYHLLLEDRRGGAEVRGRGSVKCGGKQHQHDIFSSVEHMSLLAHLTSLSLNHLPITMVAPSDSQVPKLRPFLPLRSSLPCDVHLLNLRTLEDSQESDSPSQEVALLLHRKGFDCSSAPQAPLQCTWSAQEEVDTHIHVIIINVNCKVVKMTYVIHVMYITSYIKYSSLQVDLDRLFSPLRFHSVRRSGLTLLREDDQPESARQPAPPHVARLRPMEISAFRVEVA
uniref:mannosyl-oligosaccharide 1,3-1,6-alpha-mannosidase n=1 Tax=Gasterosteus aculeatus aculeatus TaxID=481459 RepID=A0AAQ4QAA2_GASAC